MTLNLTQLLCVLQREENWSRERTARRAQPAASPAGIKESAPPPGRARLRASSAGERRAAPARTLDAAEGESKRTERMGQRGGDRRLGRR